MNTPAQPGHGPTPPAPSKASPGDEALVKALYKSNVASGHASLDDIFGTGAADKARDIAESAQISSPPEKGKDKDALGVRKKDSRGIGWVYAPSTSHISRFVMTPGDDQKSARIQVVFKGPEGRGEVAEYAYFFSDYTSALNIFNLMRGSPHPYGLVLYPKVIQAGIAYAPLALGG